MNRTVSMYAIMLVLLAAPACNKASTSPSNVSTTPTVESCTSGNNSGCYYTSRGFTLNLYANNNGTPIAWTYTVMGLTQSGTGDKKVTFTGAQPGDIEVTGQILERGGLSVTVLPVASEVEHGVVANSVQSLEGPGGSTTCAGVNYLIPFGGSGPQAFKFKFRIADGRQTSCF